MPFMTDLLCRKCNHTWEALLDKREDPNEECPKCRSNNVERVPGGVIATIHDMETLQASLKKRSADHSLREMKKHAGHKGTLPTGFGRTKGNRIGD